MSTVAGDGLARSVASGGLAVDAELSGREA
jgi:hypothetical protein